jgi:hypothetical protein
MAVILDFHAEGVIPTRPATVPQEGYIRASSDLAQLFERSAENHLPGSLDSRVGLSLG